MIVFYAQGGGLGHLTRTHRLIQYLKINAEDVLIITPSSFTHYFKQYAFISISWNDRPVIWSRTLSQQLEDKAVTTCYIDAFPLGLKGELIAVYKAFSEITFIYTCRILRWKRYLSDMPEFFKPKFEKTLVLETIYDAHLDWVTKTTAKVIHLKLSVPIFEEQERLTESPYALLVHSGGKQDVIELCNRVKIALKDTTIAIYVFSQVAVEFDDERFQFRIQEYPVERYFQNATKIYTAAGFNLMNELALYQEKHSVFPIERLYDDQFFRSRKMRENLPLRL